MTNLLCPGGAEFDQGQASHIDRALCICNYICMWAIRFARDVERDLKILPAHQRRALLDAIELQLSHEPDVATRNRKLLVNLIPPWIAEPPVWELRVGRFRVFYDIAVEERTVFVRAVREKPPGKTTKEIL